jgi:hypothetical protein
MKKTAYDYFGPEIGPLCQECGSRHVRSYIHPEDRLQGSQTKDGGYGYGFEYDREAAKKWRSVHQEAGKS